MSTNQTPIHVVGIGLDGTDGLTDSVRQVVAQATLLVGSARHLSYFPDHEVDRLVLGDFLTGIAQIRQAYSLQPDSPHLTPTIVILTSGDPLFFGLGRLLLAEFPAEQLTFHPHLSSVQLAFSRIKLPWQDARLISAHGRSLDELTQALQQGIEKIAILTDPTHSPAAIAELLQALELPSRYQMWVCENLGGSEERITTVRDLAGLAAQTFASLNVVVLQRSTQTVNSIDLAQLPLFGIPDSAFLSFSDRPGLMTKREVRVQILGELGLQPGQTIWDIGAGTGSVAIEMARLCPTAKVYAIEKTAIGSTLIEQNCQRFQVENVVSFHGTAPSALKTLPQPDRIFIGGSGGNLTAILEVCGDRLRSGGRIVLALATLEHLQAALTWLSAQTVDSPTWNYRLVQLQISRSTPIANLTRFSPLNPVTLVVVEKATGIRATHC